MSDRNLTIAICSRCAAGEKLGAALAARLSPLGPAHGFHVESVACFAGCDRPLAVAFTAPAKASFLFGDINPDSDVEALLSFARLYATRPGGWCSESDRPTGLRGKTLARIPYFDGASS